MAGRDSGRAGAPVKLTQAQVQQLRRRIKARERTNTTAKSRKDFKASRSTAIGLNPSNIGNEYRNPTKYKPASPKQRDALIAAGLAVMPIPGAKALGIGKLARLTDQPGMRSGSPTMREVANRIKNRKIPKPTGRPDGLTDNMLRHYDSLPFKGVARSKPKPDNQKKLEGLQNAPARVRRKPTNQQLVAGLRKPPTPYAQRGATSASPRPNAAATAAFRASKAEAAVKLKRAATAAARRNGRR